MKLFFIEADYDYEKGLQYNNKAFIYATNKD